MEILTAGAGVEPKGVKQIFVNGTSSEQTYPYSVLEEQSLSVETSVTSSLEISRVIGASRSAGVVTTVATKTATTAGAQLKVPPGKTGYVQPYVQFTRVAYKNIDHTVRFNILGTWWCSSGTIVSYRSAKIPTASIICAWLSPDTRCTRTMLQGGGGGYGQPPGSGTAGPAPGPVPVTDVRSVSDGTLLHATDTGRIYKMVGGAPVWQATCNDGICNTTPRPTTQSVIDAGPATPRNGASAVDQRGRVYIFIGGAPIWQDSCAAPVSCGTPVKISDWSIDARNHMSQEPADGALVQAKEGNTDLPVAMTLGGALVPFATPQEVIDTGYGTDWTSKVVAISGGSYNRIGFIPRTGTLIQGTAGGTSTPVAAVLGGARINFANAQEVIDVGHGANWASKVRGVPTRHFNAMPTVPEDGTLIQGAGNGGPTPVAAMVGAARVNFASEQEVIDAGYGTDWASKVHAIPARAFNEIRTQIIDGTRIGKSGSTSEGAVVGGAKVPFISGAERDETGYASQPLQKIPARVWDAMSTTVADGTRIGKSGSTSEGAVVGGAKVPFISGAERDETGYGTKPLQEIPARVWDAMSTTVADGTRIGKSGSTSEGAVVGGAKVPFISGAERDETGYGTKPLQEIPARVWDAMSTTVADGTRIGKSGSTSEGAVVGGAKVPFISGAERDETGYGTKPLQKIPARVWDAMSTTVADGTRIKAPDSTIVWIMTNGHRVTTGTSTNVWVVPARVIDAIPLA
ncbi:hypothetical protein [Nonomuraea aurantiaca]|uniref:hypothetical protein n=1 Tax=Nonomuraea aurantiaca TaxID=2878562 RepID=UPI001CD9932B|nr:hypothetical protein [Nonomuraea aurantiaca]MCA2229600.1 hypothetical protein [Nonomuraea aurantiaca]